MFFDLYKGRGIVLEPVDRKHILGNYVCLRTNLKKFVVHSDELFKQRNHTCVFPQTTNPDRFLAFDDEGRLYAVLHGDKFWKYCILLVGAHSGKDKVNLFSNVEMPKSQLTRAPSEFVVPIKRFYEPPPFPKRQTTESNADLQAQVV